jgi:hypothetical protein
MKRNPFGPPLRPMGRGRRFGQVASTPASAPPQWGVSAAASTTAAAAATTAAVPATSTYVPGGGSAAVLNQLSKIQSKIVNPTAAAPSTPSSTAASYLNPTSAQAPVLQKLKNLQVQIAALSAANQVKSAQLAVQQAAVQGQGTMPVRGPQDVLRNLRNVLPDYLVPGNLGDVNRVVWPFWFTNITPELPAAVGTTQTTSTATVTITQEAAFIITDILKAIFIFDPIAGTYTYVDPSQPGQAGLTPGLTMQLVDAQSSRVFMSKPVELDTIGYSQFPYELPTPIMFLPNSIIQTQFTNTNTSFNYIPWVTFLGVRCRIEDSQRIMGLITG